MIIKPKDKYIDASEHIETKNDLKSYHYGIQWQVNCCLYISAKFINCEHASFNSACGVQNWA